MHTTEGDPAGTGTYNYLMHAGVSAHVVIGPTGIRYRVCNDDDISWHAGITFNPSTPLYDGTNPNIESRGIEFAGTYLNALTSDQIASGIEQIKEWQALDGAEHPIVAHSELATGGPDMRRDPGSQNMAAIQAALEDQMTDAQMAELKAYIDAKVTVIVAATVDEARRLARGEDPGKGFGAEPEFKSGESIFQTAAK